MAGLGQRPKQDFTPRPTNKNNLLMADTQAPTFKTGREDHNTIHPAMCQDARERKELTRLTKTLPSADEHVLTIHGSSLEIQPDKHAKILKDQPLD